MKSLTILLLSSLFIFSVISCGSHEIEPKRQYNTIEDNGDGSSSSSNNTRYYIAHGHFGLNTTTQMILKHNGEFYRYDWIYEFKNEIHTFSATSYQGSWANGSNGIIEYTIGSSDRIQLSGRNHESNECHDYVKNLRFNEQKKYFDTNKYSRKGSFTEITYNFFCINNMKDFYLHR